MYIFTLHPDSDFVQDCLDTEGWEESVQLKIYSSDEWNNLPDEEKINHFFCDPNDPQEQLNKVSEAIALITQHHITLDKLAENFAELIYRVNYPEEYAKLLKDVEEADIDFNEVFIDGALGFELPINEPKWKLAWIDGFYELFGEDLEEEALKDPNVVITHETKKD